MKPAMLIGIFLTALAHGGTHQAAQDSARAGIMMLDTLSTPVKIDIKTGLGDKEKSKLAKAGLIAYLKQSDWAEVVNFGESYAIWIENFQRKLRGNTIRFQLDLELRTRADIGAGKLLMTRHIADTVDMSDLTELKTFQDRELFQLIEKKLSHRLSLKSLVSSVLGVTAKVGIPGVGGIIQGGLKNIGNAEKQYNADEAVEGMVVGAILVIQTREMLNEVMTTGKK